MGDRDYTPYLVVGGLVIGGAGLYWYLNKRNESQEEWYQKFLADVATLNALTQDYIDETQALFAKLNNWSDSGQALTEAQQQELQNDEATINAKEPIIAAQSDVVTNDAKNAGSTAPDPVTSILGGLGLLAEMVPYAIIGAGIIGGLYGVSLISSLVARIRKDWNDTHKPPPSATVPVTGEVVTGASINALVSKLLEKLKQQQVDADKLSVVVPAAQDSFITLPYWAQNLMASCTFDAALVDGVVLDWKFGQNWEPQMSSYPGAIRYVVIGGLIAAILVIALQPELSPIMGDVVNSLSLAFVGA